MQKMSEYMVAIEKQISLLCEQKLTVERLLRDQLELQQDIADKLFASSLEIEDIYFPCRSGEDATISIKADSFDPALVQILEKYMDNRPYALRGKIRSLDVRINDLCRAWEKLDEYRDMGFIDLGEKTATDYADGVMDYIARMNEDGVYNVYN
jgi:hypothetical protein